MDDNAIRVDHQVGFEIRTPAKSKPAPCVRFGIKRANDLERPGTVWVNTVVVTDVEIAILEIDARL